MGAHTSPQRQSRPWTGCQFVTGLAYCVLKYCFFHFLNLNWPIANTHRNRVCLAEVPPIHLIVHSMNRNITTFVRVMVWLETVKWLYVCCMYVWLIVKRSTLSLSVSPQLTVPATLFRTHFWRTTSQISCFLIIWVQKMTAKVRAMHLVICWHTFAYTQKTSIPVIVCISIIITRSDYLHQF